MGGKPFPRTVDGAAVTPRPVRLWWLAIVVSSLAGWAAMALGARALVHLIG